MRRGQPLTDRDRGPWLLSLQAVADSHARGCAKERAIIACSALKRAYRHVLRGTHPPSRIAIVRAPTWQQCVDCPKEVLGANMLTAAWQSCGAGWVPRPGAWDVRRPGMSGGLQSHASATMCLPCPKAYPGNLLCR